MYLIFSANLVTWLIFWTEMFLKKYYVLPIMPLYIGENVFAMWQNSDCYACRDLSPGMP